MHLRRAALLALILSIGASPSAAPRPGVRPVAEGTNLAGRWTLNLSQSKIPDDLGFGMDLINPSASGGEEAANPAMANYRESADDAARREHLVNEVRHPPEELAITQTDETIAMAGDQKKPRTFYLDGRETAQPLGIVTVYASARWNGPRLEIRYRVQQNRELRYEFSRTSTPDRLVVEVRFIERNGHDVATLVYEPTRDDAPPRAASVPAKPPASAGVPSTSGAPNLGGLGQAPTLMRPGAQNPAPPPATTAPPAPPLGGAPRGPVATGPDAALAGLKELGVVVEELRPQAAACGLTHAPLEAIVMKAFTDAGFKVTRDADEDTYVYVDIGTTNVTPTLCVSRYDVYLFTSTVAPLSYQPGRQALVQVQLAHEGGLAGGAPAAHGESVRANVKRAVDSFVTRIRTATGRQ